MATAAAAVSAGATGTVTVNGTVTAKCSNTGGNKTISVGELADSDGKVVNTFAGTTTADLAFQCTSAAPTVSVAATPLKNTGGAPTGYTDTVQYRAVVTVDLAAGGTNATSPTVFTSGAPSTTSAVLSGQLANPGAGTNIHVAVDQPTSNGNLLTASATDGYSGLVTVTVSPTP
jgi:hypothetical protein